MYVQVEWEDNKYLTQGGYWYVKLMYGDERDSYPKGGWQVDTVWSKWGANWAARRILRTAKRAEKQKFVHRGWKVY